MESLQGLLNGFSIALSGYNILFVFLGCLLGTAVGVLPGLGPAATIALLLPVVYAMNSPATSIIFLAGIFYGSMYGGSTTSILVNLPGEAASVVTCIDGFQMAKKGRAGAALAIAAIGSFIAGSISIIGLSFIAMPISGFALKFGAPEYFALMLIGLLLAVFLSGESPLKGTVMILTGVLLANVGLDPISGKERFTFGFLPLVNGFEFVTIAMGMFGLSEIFIALEKKVETEFVTKTIGKLWLTAKDWAESKWAVVRGSLIGFFIGVIPGGSAVISSLVSYALEKKISKHPEEFCHGAIAGVAGPESANNAASSSSFVPLLTLGIPSNASIAMIFAALLVQGITPGPFLVQEHPDVFWGVIASMYIGNIMLLVLNLPLVGLWVQLLKVPFSILGPIIVLFTTVGCYSISGEVATVYEFLIFGVIGYVFKKLRFDAGPLLMSFILAPLIENSLRQSLLISGGNMLIFVTRPISGTLIAFFILIVSVQGFQALRARKNRKSGKQESCSCS